MNKNIKGSVREEEEKRQELKKLRREEEEEETDMREYYQRVEYMREHCQSCDKEISGLLEEQQGMLNVLGMKKRELLDDVDIFRQMCDFDTLQGL